MGEVDFQRRHSDRMVGRSGGTRGTKRAYGGDQDPALAVESTQQPACRLNSGITNKVDVELASIAAVFGYKVLQRLSIFEQTNAL